jgi:hypothetical protein
VLRFVAIVALGAVLAGCNGSDPSTDRRPQIALDCETVLTGRDITGLGVDPGSETDVVRGFLERRGLRGDDRLLVEHGDWEPELAAVRVTRAGRTVASFELDRAEGGWRIRAFSLCDDFGAG